MPNFDRLYATLAKRAVRQGIASLEAFVEQMVDAGVPLQNIESQLLLDLDSNGPIFGAFFRSLGGAAESAVLAAERQGSVVAMVDTDAELKRLLNIADTEDLIDSADPGLLEDVERSSATRLEVTWVAELRNTCHRCLSVHGTTRTMAEWRSDGLTPETIHNGWTSPCHCKLLPAHAAESREDLRAPLARVSDGIKGSKRTMRAVAQTDLDRSIEAMQKARESTEGRRIISALGRARGDVDVQAVNALQQRKTSHE